MFHSDDHDISAGPFNVLRRDARMQSCRTKLAGRTRIPYKVLVFATHVIPGAACPPPIRQWIDDQRVRSGLTLRTIPFQESGEWIFEEGRLRHRSNRFFSIEGLRARSEFFGAQVIEQPIINQPEIGILGFLAQVRDGVLLFLVQAKTEPGNVNSVQLAPTFQATVSNYTCAHAGAEPPFAEYFLRPSRGKVVLDQLQSEQGSRFLRKSNRNMVVQLPGNETVVHDERYCWIPVREFCLLLRFNNVVNTDSRSVLASVSWDWLAGGNAFSTGDVLTLFGTVLRESLSASDAASVSTALELDKWLLRLRQRFGLLTERVPLERLRDWSIGRECIESRANAGFRVIQMAVHARDREVENWDQPLLTNTERGLIAMLCQKRNGILHFLIQAIVEPGTKYAVQLTTTVHIVSVGNVTEQAQPFLPLADKCEGDLLWSGVHSEEGGRFFQDENVYRLIESPETQRFTLPENYCWMTLGQVRELLRRENVFTNEARSLFAALTIWL